MTGPPAGGRGHRVVPHTADVILEAWGTDLASCCDEAVAALTGLYAAGGPAAEVGRRHVHLPAGTDESLLLAVLDEVIFTLDTAAAVPVRSEARAAPDGGLDLSLILADRDTVRPAGAVPKAVARSELAVVSRPGAVRCRFLVDV
ncbi:MAG TPA: archease [Acidimicrobiales bacterium]|nr:archease [Acidimicrobiales bacterium]